MQVRELHGLSQGRLWPYKVFRSCTACLDLLVISKEAAPDSPASSESFLAPPDGPCHILDKDAWTAFKRPWTGIFPGLLSFQPRIWRYRHVLFRHSISKSGARPIFVRKVEILKKLCVLRPESQISGVARGKGCQTRDSSLRHHLMF